MEELVGMGMNDEGGAIPSEISGDTSQHAVYADAQLDRDAPPTLHSQLADIMREKIRTRVWVPGKRVASEHELMATYGLSRGTVRHAIKSLVDEGLLVQHHGRGTFVPQVGLEQAERACTFALAGPSGVCGWRCEARVLEHKVVSIPDYVATQLNVEPNASALYLHRVYLDEGKPFACVENWISIARCPGIESVVFDQGASVLEAVEGLTGKRVVHANVSFSACAAGSEHYTHLCCKETEPLLLFECVGSLEGGTLFGYGRVRLASDHAITGVSI